MNRQKNPLVGLIFFFIALSFIFGNFGGFAFFIPFIFPVIIFFIVAQIITQAKRAQQMGQREQTPVQKPAENRFERDFTKRSSTHRRPAASQTVAAPKTHYGNVSNLPGAHLTKCPKCGASMDDRYDYCFSCRTWLKQ